MLKKELSWNSTYFVVNKITRIINADDVRSLVDFFFLFFSASNKKIVVYPILYVFITV